MYETYLLQERDLGHTIQQIGTRPRKKILVYSSKNYHRTFATLGSKYVICRYNFSFYYYYWSWNLPREPLVHH